MSSGIIAMQKGFLGGKVGIHDPLDDDEEDDIRPQSPEEKLRQIFMRFDADGDGLLCYEEVQMLLSHTAQQPPEALTRQVRRI